MATYASPPPPPQEQQPATTTPTAPAGRPQFKVRSQSNAVMVHVVVRDSKGRAVSGLQKQDFELFDNKEPQTITQWPLKKVRHRIPELKGLKPAADQSQLPEVLRGVSVNLQKFVVNFVDVSALETVDEGETLSPN